MSWHLPFCCDSARRSRREEQDTRGVAVARRNISGNGDFWPAASAVQQHPRAHSMLGPGWQALRVSWRWRWDLTCLCRASMSDVNRGEEGRRLWEDDAATAKYPARESFAGRQEQCAVAQCPRDALGKVLEYGSLGWEEDTRWQKYLAEELFAGCHGRVAASSCRA
jgi:hypothetical protein